MFLGLGAGPTASAGSGSTSSGGGSSGASAGGASKLPPILQDQLAHMGVTSKGDKHALRMALFALHVRPAGQRRHFPE